MAKSIMIQGTASSVGKSVINAALCRIFFQDGHKVAPFKSQNMALNSFVTDEGLEMGRAQVVQAEACGIAPSVLMNPILLKPSSDTRTQVIINGKVYENLDAMEYHGYKPTVKSFVKRAYFQLEKDYEIIVLEGAGSPAEINLRENDIVNMGMAEISDSPVVLVSDIDRGGVFASIVGTLQLLKEEERKRVKGVIINKFRGDVQLLQPGIKMLEDIIKIPVLGVVPFFDINIEDEDSVTERFKRKNLNGEIEINVVRLPRISNFTDFDVFSLFSDVNLKYVDKVEDIKNPDVIILPGSKNTVEDLWEIRRAGIEEKIIDLYKQGCLIIGICGGFQMLGKAIEDPENSESNSLKIEGLGIIDMVTAMATEKTTTQVKGHISSDTGLLKGLREMEIKGYEIHMGVSEPVQLEDSLTLINSKYSGVAMENVIGTYVHGIFDNLQFTRGLLNNIRKRKGLIGLTVESDYRNYKEREFDKLAKIIRDNVDIDKIYKILEGEDVACS